MSQQLQARQEIAPGVIKIITFDKSLIKWAKCGKCGHARIDHETPTHGGHCLYCDCVRIPKRLKKGKDIFELLDMEAEA